MAEWLGVPYAKIALMGFLPAIILYAGLLIQVDAYAVKKGLQRFSSSEIPSLVEVLKRGWIFLIPVAVLIFCLFFLKMDAEEAALWGTLCILVLTTAKKTFRLSLRKLAVAMTDTAKSAIVVAVACAMAGVIMASVETTGFTVSITNYFVKIAGENLFLMLILSAVGSFIFGMGIGSIASYIFVVILVAPALSAFGQPDIITHFFVFWIAMAAFITPPFCVSAFVAASISHSSMMRTGFRAVGLGIGFIYIPFFFVYNPGLLLQGSLVEIVVAGICAAIGISCMAFAIEGYFIKQLNWGVRGVSIVSAILMVFPVFWIRLLALLLISLVFLGLITTTGKLQLNYKAFKAKFNNKQERPGSFLN
jgi:TRAP transporter 4TM/12TM fusion protein